MKKTFKVLSLFLCAVITFCSLSVVSFAEGENGEIILGDIDRSGKVDTQDAREILKMAAGIIANDLTLADMNGDGIISVEDAQQALIKASNIGGVVIPDKNGENYLSDDPNNEFIKLIASTYNIDTKALVAIYSVPDTGTNYVLQFKASGLLNKTYKKSPDNLYRVYHVGLAPEREISYTGGSILGIGDYNCAAGEGALVFNLVKTKVMPQYPDYFEGV